MATAVALLLGAVLALAGAPAAFAGVRSSFTAAPNTEQGTLRVESDAADSIVVACIGGGVMVNGAPPDTGPLACTLPNKIEVTGGPADNRIDLGGISPAQLYGVYRGVAASAVVDGGAGDDSIVGPYGGFVDIVGGPGSDWLEGRSILDNYRFAPAVLPEHDTIVEGATYHCEPSYFETNQPGLDYWTVPWDSLDFRALPAGDPVTVDERAPNGLLAMHRNRTVSIARIGSGTAIEAIAGGAGDDRIAGACMALGSEGNDSLGGSQVGDLLLGGEGDDTLSGGAGWDALQGGPGADVISGGRQPDSLAGGPGDDVLRGGRGDDTYIFAAGEGRESDRVGEEAGADLDTLSFDLHASVSVDLSQPEVVARSGSLEVHAEPGTSRFFEGVAGGDGNDRLVGNRARNHFWSGGGTDLAAGGAGDDVYHVDWAGSLPYGAYAWTGFWLGPFDRAEAGRAASRPQDEGLRSRLRILERGRSGFDSIDLGEGFFDYPGGGTVLEGQARSARVDFTAPRHVVLAGRVAAVMVRPGGVQYLEGIRGTSGPDVLIGNAADNVLEGGHGRDRLTGGRGRDLCLTAGDGDVFRGCERIRRVNPRR